MRALAGIAMALASSALFAGAPVRDMTAREPVTRRRLQNVGNARDRYQGIKSKGRQGATARAAEMAAAMPKRHHGPLTNPFTRDSRRKAFDAAMKDGAAIIGNPASLRRQAMKIARRVA